MKHPSRLIRVVALLAGLTPNPAAADTYIFGPADGSATVGLIWLLLLGVGTIAVWGSRAIVGRVLRRTSPPPGLSLIELKPFVLTLVIGWVVLSGFFWLVQGRGVDPAVLAFTPWPVVAAFLAGAWICVAAFAERALQKRLPPARLPVLATVAFTCCMGACIVIGVQGQAARRRSVAEPQAIGDVRTMIYAQAAYRSSNGGLYESELRCLSEPWNCIPTYPRNAPGFLDGSLAALEVERNGYLRVFHPGSRPATLPKGSSPSSVESFAYTAVPIEPGKTGVRAFCGDDTGSMCVFPDGRVPVIDGRCPRDCPTLP